jgi:CIC family chloride channel protein
LLIAAVCGSLVSLTLLGDDVLFTFVLRDPFLASDTPYFILLGILCGLISVYFTRMMYVIDAKITRIKNYLARGIVGGLLLAIIIFVLPPIYGEGYNTIKYLLEEMMATLRSNRCLRPRLWQSAHFYSISYRHHHFEADCLCTDH